MSDYQENKDLDFWYGPTVVTKPATVYAQAHTADPTDAGTGTVHPYLTTRIAIAQTLGNWPAAAAGVKQNGAKISWGSTSGVLGQPDITHVSLWDALAGGNMLDYGQLSVAVPVNDRLEVAILAGALTITRT